MNILKGSTVYTTNKYEVLIADTKVLNSSACGSKILDTLNPARF